MDVVIPGVGRIHKKKQRVELEVEVVLKWQGLCNWCMKKKLQYVPYEK